MSPELAAVERVMIEHDPFGVMTSDEGRIGIQCSCGHYCPEAPGEDYAAHVSAAIVTALAL